MKIPETKRFAGVLRGYKMGTLARNELIWNPVKGSFNNPGHVTFLKIRPNKSKIFYFIENTVTLQLSWSEDTELIF